jgi:CHAT domain-containing protein
LELAENLDREATALLTAGLYTEAEPLYREALALRQAALPAGHPDIATSLVNLGNFLEITGRYAEAEPLLREALAQRQAALPAGHADIATSLHSLATLLATTGRYAEAEPLYREALAQYQAALPAGHADIATSLHSLATLLATTGRYAEAEPLYREALAQYQAALPAGHATIAASLNNLAFLLATTGRYAEAEPLYREALALLQAALPAGHADIATSLNNLADLLATTGRYAEAEPLLREALALLQAALPAGHATIAASLNNLAALLNTTGRYAEAEPLLREALSIAEAAGEPEVLWGVQWVLSAFYAAQAQRPLAIFYGKQAVNTLQRVRQDLGGVESSTQHAYVQSKESYYLDLADLLIAEGRLPEAQQVLDMLKEQEYHDFIRRDLEEDPRQTKAAMNAVEAEQLVAYEDGGRDLARLGAEYQALAQRDPFTLTPAEEARLAELQPQLDAAYQRFQQTLTAIKERFAQLSVERREELAQRQLLLGKDDRGLVRELGAGVALLHTLVMADKVHLLLTLPELLLARQSPLGQEALNAEVQHLRQALEQQGDPRPAAQTLYRHLIAPIAPDLEAAGIHTLMVSLDGSLRYLPLAALHDGSQWLVERYALSVFTEVARDNLKDAPQRDWRGIGLGVSLPHAAVGPTRKDFGALPAVPQELDGIIRREGEDDPAGVLPGRTFLDAGFNLPTLRKALRYPVLHIASHFSLQPGNEAQSYLLLGDGSTLDLRQLRQDNFNFGAVELLTLSACQTAVGGANAQGQEIEGLGTLAQLQGAKGVIATLWSVDDPSTGVFMQALYRLRQEGGLSKAEALRQAQLGFITATGAACGPAPGDASELTAGPTPPADGATEPACHWRHPFFWAPFILMGNWL